MRGNVVCLCGDKRGYDPEMTKYAVDTLTAYSILTLALSYTYQDYTTAPLPYRISYIYTYHLRKNVKTTDRPVSGMCQFPTFL
jgi:hypothetical protein